MNNQTQFTNPVYQPVQTPLMTMYSNIFSSQTPFASSKGINQEPIVTAMDQIIEDRTSAEFGQHSRHISLNYQIVENDLRKVVEKKNYVACQIF
ncbi:unnamed protein product (macronuclear) [Paramecium tetraurelia]|uniref:Uncharacterized protein n=2 Tax=Paramecium TaxID=5884 RepID=A0BSM6_PARTE|nr:uncharacterized protein GSPATT00031775001 [Paramecium tetraurelia]CAK61543.1 unnamed protein product [Paramecium tetraurelia]|eukprot:XP_001428941.1 hypothetical protein (macronuclear) [Paramecium tetraurelia strain d4-2]